MIEAVNVWLFDLELEGLATVQSRDVSIADIVFKAPLSSNFGTALEALSDSNFDTELESLSFQASIVACTDT